ncbi:MAG: hypothetical protein JWL70_3120, partial [Acidimicrobiia bacterium]|nr:hypothetical protein [Acidimicrobiia bacterium]
AELSLAIEAWEGGGLVVLAGKLFDAGVGKFSPAAALAAHPRLTSTLARFASGEGRAVFWLPGAAELAAGELEGLRREFTTAIPGAVVTPSVRLAIETGLGERLVLVEPDGPGARSATSVSAEPRPEWLSGLDLLEDPGSLPRFVSSRLLYRQVGRRLWLLLLPFVLAVLIKLPLSFALHGRLDRSLGAWSDRLGLIAVTTAIDLVLVAILVFFIVTRGWQLVVGPRSAGTGRNDASRAKARSFVADGGVGLIAGCSQAAELANFSTGFFACPGMCGEAVTERPARGRLPPVFIPERVLSWVEMDAGAELRLRLMHGRVDAPGASLLEHLAAQPSDATRPAVVASFPEGESWPRVEPPSRRTAQVRRRASAAIALGGVVNLAAALTPPLEDRLSWLLDWVPLGVPEAATIAIAVAGLGLIFLARGVRRGQTNAWRIALALLSGSVVLHLLAGADLEEALVAAAIGAYLLVHRRHFRAPTESTDLRRSLVTAVAVLPVLLVAAVVVVEIVSSRVATRLTIPDAVRGSVERMVAVRSVKFPHRLDQFMSPVLVTITAGVLVRIAWLLVRPVASRRGSHDDRKHARTLVKNWGASTLDYFALRTDKELFFSGSSVVAYGVQNGVCLVSPDPIGPRWERDEVWSRFRHLADEQGWILAVLGVGDDWLPVYRSSGMHDLYVGDEGLVDVRRFSLDGGRHKSLRQAVNRVAKKGYTISFHDPARIDPEVAAGVRAIMDKSRRGDVERGFSMTLGRIFDPTDEDLLLAVCHGPDGVPVAFCQYVPAPGIVGYSLDLMRRDDGDHPNGLLDFVIVETIRYLGANGLERLSLNFATMRAVLAGEMDNNLTARIERWALRRMSGSMQIESLWRFNAKFDPDWQARYIAYDSPEHVVQVAVAVARAESFWELPIIGRFLQPNAARPAIEDSSLVDGPVPTPR